MRLSRSIIYFYTLKIKVWAGSFLCKWELSAQAFLFGFKKFVKGGEALRKEKCWNYLIY